MKLLLLNGHGANMRVDNAKLHIKDGSYAVDVEPEKHIFSPKKIDIDHVIFYSKSGSLTLESIRWLIKHNIQISILDWNGKLLTTMLPPESVQVATKFSQYSAYNDMRLRTQISKQLIASKFARTQIVLDLLKLRYPNVKTDFSKEFKLFQRASTIDEIRIVEGRVASFYWQQLIKVIPEKHEFESRRYQHRPWGASDTVNVMLNYGYAVLEAECMRAINTAGMDVHVGFMHEKRIGKNSLAYDLQELFRFLVDLAVIKLIETNAMEKKDFIRTENYTLRLRPTGARKLVTEINDQLNNKVRYNGKECSWTYVMLLKTRELAHFLVGKKKKLDLIEPLPKLHRQDTEEMRKKILAFSYTDWENMGFSRGTLFYLKKNAKANKPFTMNKHVEDRLLKL